MKKSIKMTFDVIIEIDDSKFDNIDAAAREFVSQSLTSVEDYKFSLEDEMVDIKIYDAELVDVDY